MKNWQVEILNSFSFGYSNVFLEGINNKTKVMKPECIWLSSKNLIKFKV
ncbi:transposase [Lysinibacillus sp. NPDC094403]